MNEFEKSTLLTIVGPTGVGKTALAVEIAQRFNGELISADSRQIYIGMDIATGKEVSLGEWRQVDEGKALVIDGVPIFGLDLVLPNEEFSVADWHQQVLTAVARIKNRGHLPIIVGGTGFYLQALQGKIGTLSIAPDIELRQELEQLSTDELRERLGLADPAKMSIVDSHNRRRLIRAIEVAKAGQLENQVRRPKTDSFDLKMIGLTMERYALYAKIDQRIEQMFKEGLVEETKCLLATYSADLPALSGIGYAEAAAYLVGDITLSEAIQKVKWRNHAYVRRQYTWFRKQEVDWVAVDQPDWHNQVNASIERWLAL